MDYEQFKQEYSEYMKLNKKEVTDKDVKKAWNQYKEGYEDNKVPNEIEVSSDIKKEISQILKDIKKLREDKKSGIDIGDQLKTKMKRLKELREIKKNGNS
jgi:hypothetical protein